MPRQRTGVKGTVRRFLRVFGPGLVAGASDNDPSAIGSFATAGAATGFATLWTALFIFPMAVIVQFICAKVGMVGGVGIAGALKKYYSPLLLYPIVFALTLANTIAAGADIGAIAAAINLLAPIPIAVLIVPIAATILMMQLWLSYRRIVTIFKWLTFALFAYVGAAFLAHPNWAEVLRQTFIPTFSFDSKFLSAVVALFGATLSPYLFFWQASQRVEEQLVLGRKHRWQRTGASDSEVTYAVWDINIGMFVAIAVMYFIILASAVTLHHGGQRELNSAADVAKALEPLAGRAAGALLAVGLIGSGLLAVPVLTGSAAYAISEVFGWEYGLNHHPGRAREFYATIAASTVIGLIINFIGISPIRALFLASVINGFLAPPLWVVVLLIANNKSIMGVRTNGWAINIAGALIAVVLFAAAVTLLVSWVN